MFSCSWVFAWGLLLSAAWLSAQPVKRDRWGQPGTRVNLPGGPWLQGASNIDVRGNRLCATLRGPSQRWAPRSCVNVQPGSRYENRAGQLALHTPDEIPGGTWVQTARNIRREGDLLTFQLRREDLSYSTVSIVTAAATFFKNLDGQLYRSRAACVSMGSCLLGYFMKPYSSFILCGDVQCFPDLDLHICCEEAMPCSNLTTCVLPQVPDPLGYCDGATCIPDRDEDLCCKGVAKCDSFNCEYGFQSKPGAADIKCMDTVCDPELEIGLCCDASSRCLTFEDQSCPQSYFFNELEFCLGMECMEKRDRLVCCQAAQKCNGFECPWGFWPLYNETELWCDGPTCIDERDTDTCCDPAEPCQTEAIDCPFGRVTINDTYCKGTSCYPPRDLGHCCLTAERCNGLDHYDCSLGYFLNQSDYCNGTWCVESRDRDLCCQEAAPCTALQCPFGYIAKPFELLWAPGVPYDPDATEPTEAPVSPPDFGDEEEEEEDQVTVTTSTTTTPAFGVYVENLYCIGLHCAMGRDRDVCCDFQATCTDLVCPLGYVSALDAADRLCLGPACVLERDRDVCCNVAANCTQEYTCPHGHVGKAVAFCDGTECEVERDLDNCCDHAMPCTQNLTCMVNYIYRPDTYCSKAIHEPNACTNEVDHDTCCTRGMAIKYFRFQPLKVRGGRANYQVQLSEFLVYAFGERLEGSRPWDEPGPVAFSVDGNYPLNENPSKAIDGSDGTKWLDEDPVPNRPLDEPRPWKALTIQLPKAQPCQGYSFVTANDDPGRDPAEWLLLGSTDNVQYVVIDNITNGASTVPEERRVETPLYRIKVPCFAPLPKDVPNAGSPFPCLEGDIMSHGQVCTASCRDGYEPSVATLLCTNGLLEPLLFSCLRSL